MLTKHEIRAIVKSRIATMTADERMAQSRMVAEQLTALNAWQDARTVLLYASLPDEVDTTYIIREAERCGKRIVLPAIDGATLQLRYYEPSHVAPIPSHYNIVEPTDEATPLHDVADVDMAVVPGRAFTDDGRRVGRGKGYYDRLLPQLRCPTVGIAYGCQLFADLPTDAWDTRLDIVLAGQYKEQKKLQGDETGPDDVSPCAPCRDDKGRT